jgi:hypothetical protein
VDNAHWILLIFTLAASSNDGKSLLFSHVVIVTICDPAGEAVYSKDLTKNLQKLAEAPIKIKKIITTPLQDENDKCFSALVDFAVSSVAFLWQLSRNTLRRCFSVLWKKSSPQTLCESRTRWMLPEKSWL